MTPAERTDHVRRLALEAGFDAVGIAPTQPIARIEYFHQWLDRGFAGEMTYLSRHRRVRVDPSQLLPGARSVIVVAHNYHQGPVAGTEGGDRRSQERSSTPDQPHGRVAQYAWGRDYHRVLRKQLKRLADELHRVMDVPMQTRVFVDTAPLMERELAAAAGIGWIGKNTMVLDRRLGSFFFLGEIVTTLDLAPSKAATDHCGTCTRCLDACPTGALIAPYQMDATRCIAYLTIEHRSGIAGDLQPLMGDWVFGCDVCQEVCPYNGRAPAASEPAYRPREGNPLAPQPVLDEVLSLTQPQYQQHASGTAIKRATLAMLQRNAAIARENQARASGASST